jgi:hypothetical protein
MPRRSAGILFRVKPVTYKNHYKACGRPTEAMDDHSREEKNKPSLAVRTTALFSTPFMSIARLLLPAGKGQGHEKRYQGY